MVKTLVLKAVRKEGVAANQLREHCIEMAGDEQGTDGHNTRAEHDGNTGDFSGQNADGNFNQAGNDRNSKILPCRFRKKISNQGSDPRAFSCTLCSMRVRSKNSLLRHMKIHNGNYSFYCSKCDYKAIDRRDYLKHMQWHTGEFHICSSCGFRTTSITSLVSHEKMHRGDKPHACTVCKYRCCSNYRLAQHMETHATESCYACDVCGMTFRTNIRLRLHSRKHTGKYINCQDCGFRTVSRENLKNHILVHTKDKKYSCHLCSYKAQFKQTLDMHVRRIHIARGVPSLCGINSLKKIFRCSDCSDRFSSKWVLINHMAKHTGEKPYSCSMCDFKCRWPVGLEEHQRKHAGHYFYCDVCDFKTTKECNIPVHALIHTGEKPFSCAHCDFRATRKFNLMTHIKKCHW